MSGLDQAAIAAALAEHWSVSTHTEGGPTEDRDDS
jgi:hypothetical protein